MEIIVGVDGSEFSATALAWAVREGVLHNWTVRAVLAWNYLDQHHIDPEMGFDPQYREADAARALEHYVERAVGEQDAHSVEQTLVCDHPGRALLEASASAHLLVLGPRGLGGFKGLMMGSVSQQCLSHSTASVAIVHDAPTRAPHGGARVVVGIDGSDAGERALRWAIEEARVRDAELEIVHAWHMPYIGGYPYTVAAYDPTPFEGAARDTLEAAADLAIAGDLPRPVQRTLASGSAAEAILSAAEGVDLVIVGSRGLGGFTGLLLGSVSHQVAHHAPCPVVVVGSHT